MRLSRDHHSLQLRLTRDIVSVWFGGREIDRTAWKARCSASK